MAAVAETGGCRRTGGRGGHHGHARGDLGLEHFATDQRGGDGPATGEDRGVVDAEARADQEERGRAVGIDARRAIPADQLRREIGDAGVEEFKTAAGVFIRNLRGERLQT